MEHSSIEGQLRKQMARQEADHTAEVACITADRDAIMADRDAITAERDAIAAERDAILAERNKLAKKHSDLNDAYLRTAQRQEFVLQQANKLEKVVNNAGLDLKSRNLLRKIFHKFNIKIRSAKEEAKEVSKQLEIKSKEIQEQNAQLNTEEMTLNLRAMGVEDKSEGEACEEEEDVKMALA